MKRHMRALNLPAISSAVFPIAFAKSKPAPIVISAYLGKRRKRRPGFSVVQAWCVTGKQHGMLEQFRGRAEFEKLEDILNEYIELFRPAAVLATSAPGNPALIAKIAYQLPHLVHAIEPDRDSEAAWLRALTDVVVGKRISIPAGAPWRDVCVQQFRDLPASKSKALVRAAMQFVAHAHYFTAPATTERHTIAAGVAGLRAMTVDRQPGERPGLCSDGRDITKRSLAGPIFHITTEVIY